MKNERKDSFASGLAAMGREGLTGHEKGGPWGRPFRIHDGAGGIGAVSSRSTRSIAGRSQPSTILLPPSKTTIGTISPP